MDRLLFGDNQFFGVNHMSEEKARAQAIQFQELDAIIDVLASACDHGITTFMCTTHDRISDVVQRSTVDDRLRKLTFYPGMPYAHKYANAVTEYGMIGAVRRFLPEEGALNAITRGGASLARRDIEGIMTLLIDAEMKMFTGATTPVIFLQNVVVDLLLGMGFTDAFATFARHVRTRYGAEPGFITMNLPKLLPVLTEVGLENPIVCANINKLGFRMSGGVAAYIDALRDHECRAIAMSVFASGAIPPREALEWIAEMPAIQSVVFGASSRKNIESTALIAADIWGG